MKGKVFISSLVFASLWIFSSYTFYPGGRDRGEVLMDLMIRGLEEYHYQPVAINDDFSGKVFNEYLDRLDYNKRFLLQGDVNEFYAFQDKVDDEIKEHSFQLFDLSVQKIDQRVKEAEKIVEEILENPFDFTIEESIETDPEKLSYASTEAELRERWRKELKYQTLSRVATSLKRQETKQEEDEEDFEPKSVEELEKEAREKVMKNYERYFKRLKGLNETDRLAVYFNSIANIYDPHTSYFPPKDKEDFDIDMSGRFEGIGAQLREEDGYIKVVRIIPGSASFRQGDLQPNDVILKVAQSKEDAVDVVGMDMDEAVSMIRGPKGTTVKLTVRHPDGAEKVIPIKRDIVELEETYAKSSIITDEATGKRMGFIHLPKFYADFGGTGGPSSAEDIARELVKLKEAEVDGITLDLRNNGGGSLGEVIEMTGLFIKRGPVVQVRSRNAPSSILSDKNSAVVYDGPLVVMVNAFSASASEILAAAIQDYGRGVIVGSPSTFGKGTVQRFLNLDRFVSGGADLKPLGDVKLTMQKFYRINGGATQLKGVVPDIVLPDQYSLLKTGEKDYEYSMEWDEIPAADYEKFNKSVDGKVSSLSRKSAKRVSENGTFQLIEENAARYKRNSDRSSYPLQMEAYRQMRKDLDDESKKYKDISKKIDDMTVSYVDSDASFIRSDSTRQKRYDNWFKNLGKDPYIYESLQVLQDMQ
ncbi:MAG: carboxy terminal-processing peptidase [Bacteroidota bacterium]